MHKLFRRCATSRFVESPQRQALGLRWASLLAAYEQRTKSQSFVPDACQTKCLKRLDSLHSALLRSSGKSDESPRGLYMYGGVGTGKTMMLDLFHQEVTAAGIKCNRQHFHEFLQDVHSRLHKLRQRVGAMQGLLGLAAEEYKQEFPVLAFDEAHVLNVGDALMLRTFFEAYFQAGGVMVATSNVAPDDLYSSGINREVFLPFLNALRDRCDFFEMQGRHDYRTRATKAGHVRGSYLWHSEELPRGDASPADFPALQKALRLSSSTPSVSSVDIDVGFGRKLRCDTAWRYEGKDDGDWQIVQFSFDDLCRTATGPSEWVGLADYADGIIVTGVPRFPVHDEDAARRFITFVDIVYDRQRFLAMTAEVGPDEIFSELVEKYSGEKSLKLADNKHSRKETPQPPSHAESKMKMPGHGLASGRHGVVFQRPNQLQYGSSGAYVTSALSEGEQTSPSEHMTSSTQTGGRAEHGVGSPERVMTGTVEEDSDWVEWSATGLKDASLFDLSPVDTTTQADYSRC
eukprot:TRINITY_DN23605_c0_g1_i1.p1 TRINITY_DN23605_c0_g1~~TRINITY_DN23605_c0_g1_i1.p1  ORF type:complete len:517 (-),score=80.59 TRINITY_DN23605_c0_g1_i1:320-1870(-)